MDKRVWEIDFFRGIALALMVYFHIVYDMSELYGYAIEYSSGINLLAGRSAGILFILISGASCIFSSNNLKRGLRILCFALAITLVTHIACPPLVIMFGILHLLGTCIILYSLCAKAHWLVLAASGALVMAIKPLIGNISATHDFLFFLGIHSPGFSSSDYYPLIPWLGVFLLGAAAGKLLYKEKKSLLVKSYRDNVINMAGRHTLLIYLAHQPVIIFFLELLSRL